MEHKIIDSHVAKTHSDFSIVSPKLTIEAMRDSGYKDTDHALAELIDNSVEAKATLIEILAVETPPNPDTPYARARVNEIAIIDNGVGMNHITLRRSLRFGDGTRMHQRKGIGRFGVGLPQSSISQCQRVDIWTWQNGVDNAFHCYLDLVEIQNSGQQDVPEPKALPVPDRWRTISSNTSEPTGTLIVWSQLDRVRWSGGAKTLQRTAELCGRIYRNFLANESPIIINLVLASGNGSELTFKDSRECLPNDPLYLMKPSDTPKPFANRSMFELFNERTWSIPTDDRSGKIHVRCTMAKADAINESQSDIPWPKSYPNPGAAPWGKHADRNKGVSIIRAHREVELSTAWVNNYEPEERWWSVEVAFDPILDEIFGVVNNKQHAHNFVSGASFNWQDWADSDESFGAFCERLEETSDFRSHFLEIWKWIDEQISAMRRERAKIRKGTRSPRHPSTDEAIEDVATKVITEQVEQGEKGTSDEAPVTTNEEKIQQIAESVEQIRVDPQTAQEWAKETVYSGRRVLIKAVALGHKDAFFDIESVNDVIEVWLNDQHPVHKQLIEVVTPEKEEQSTEELTKRLEKASFTLRMLLIAWARHEDKAPLQVKESLEDVRMDWGREARKFFSVIES